MVCFAQVTYHRPENALESPRSSTTVFARRVGSPTSVTESFTAASSARRKRASASRCASACVVALVVWIATLAFARSRWVCPDSGSTTSSTSPSVGRATVSAVADAS